MTYQVELAYTKLQSFNSALVSATTITINFRSFWLGPLGQPVFCRSMKWSTAASLLWNSIATKNLGGLPLILAVDDCWSLPMPLGISWYDVRSHLEHFRVSIASRTCPFAINFKTKQKQEGFE